MSFTSANGKSIVFSLRAPYVFGKASGLSVPRAQAVSARAVGVYGSVVSDILAEERTVELTAHIHAKSGARELYERRRELNAVLTPQAGVGTLAYENDAGAWKIPAFVKSCSYQNRVGAVQTAVITFVCPNPFWLCGQERALRLSYINGGLTFPNRLPGTFGLMGYLCRADVKTDVPAPVVIYIGGSAKNPAVFNETTGEFVKVNKILSAHEAVEINTSVENPSVTIIGADSFGGKTRENGYGFLSPDSALFSLVPGENVIRFSSEIENAKSVVRVFYHELSAGV
jgi:hypothetical protein